MKDQIKAWLFWILFTSYEYLQVLARLNNFVWGQITHLTNINETRTFPDKNITKIVYLWTLSVCSVRIDMHWQDRQVGRIEDVVDLTWVLLVRRIALRVARLAVVPAQVQGFAEWKVVDLGVLDHQRRFVLIWVAWVAVAEVERLEGTLVGFGRSSAFSE